MFGPTFRMSTVGHWEGLGAKNKNSANCLLPPKCVVHCHSIVLCASLDSVDLIEERTVVMKTSLLGWALSVGSFMCILAFSGIRSAPASVDTAQASSIWGGVCGLNDPANSTNYCTVTNNCVAGCPGSATCSTCPTVTVANVIGGQNKITSANTACPAGTMNGGCSAACACSGPLTPGVPCGFYIRTAAGGGICNP
jgi:hypothetical protein